MVADYIRVSFSITYNNYPKRRSQFYFVFKYNDYSKLIKFSKEVAELDGGIFNIDSETLYIRIPDFLWVNYKYYHIRQSIFGKHDIETQFKRRDNWIKKTDEIWKKINKEKHE